VPCWPYEAGYDGFWLARALAKMGIECRVLDPASIQVNRRARRVKTDRIDVLALLRALIATDRGSALATRPPRDLQHRILRPIKSLRYFRHPKSGPVMNTMG
jgi:transposase